MKTYRPEAGESIGETAQKMVALALPREPVSAVFNGIEVTASFGDSTDKITQDYLIKSERRHEEYINSPEGKKAAREAEERKVTSQQKYDALVQKLPNLNFADVESVLDWLCELQGPSDHIGVVKQSNVIIATFALKGYFINANTGSELQKDDRDNHARYIIGQALSCIEYIGAPHGVIHSFVERWKQRFGR